MVDARSRSAVASRFDALLTSAVDGIIIIRQDGIIETANPAAARLFQYEVAEFINRNVKFLMPASYSTKHDGYLHNYKTTGHRKIIGIGREVTGQRKDGSHFPMHLSVGEFEEDGVKFFTGIIHDLTDRMEAEHALRQSQKMEVIGQLTGGIAHDFNNLLTVIIGNLELLEIQVGALPMARLLHEAQSAADLAANLTQHLLQFARRSPLEPQVVDLGNLVRQISPLLKRTLGDNIALKTVHASDGWTVKLDPAQFQSAIVNLAINARDAMPEGGQLVIESRNFAIDGKYLPEDMGMIGGDYVAVSITDTGRGMPPEIVDRVFEPFFTTKPPGAGTGLGLSMVYGFIKQSGGDVKIYSDVGKGTTISLYVPCHSSSTGAEAVQDPVPVTSEKGENRVILVVEDNLQVLALTCRRLEALGYLTITAVDGPSALRALRENPQIALVLTDLVMPGTMSGYDVAQYVAEYHPSTPVVLTSGYAEELINADKLDAHHLILLRKPYKQAILAQTLKIALANGAGSD